MADIQDKPFIAVRGLSLKTPMGHVYDDVLCNVDAGKVCALFGDAGSGKTALLLTLCGRMKESSGTATVGGLDLRRGYRQVRHMSAISFIPGLNDVQPFLRVKNIMAAELSLVGKKGNKANTDEFLERCGFADKKDERFDDLDSYDKAYFGIMLACASDPRLLGVDDVQTDLTQYQSVKLVKLLKSIAESTGATVLFNCTEYEIARHADGIVVMGEGAESQRQAVIRDAGQQMSAPIFGFANGVEAGSHSARRPEERVPQLGARG